jgi:hypothetical protein
MKNTQEVLNHHLQSFNEGIDSILSDYVEKSMIMAPLKDCPQYGNSLPT